MLNHLLRNEREASSAEDKEKKHSMYLVSFSDTKWQIFAGTWYMVHGTWYMVHGTWYV